MNIPVQQVRTFEVIIDTFQTDMEFTVQTDLTDAEMAETVHFFADDKALMKRSGNDLQKAWLTRIASQIRAIDPLDTLSLYGINEAFKTEEGFYGPPRMVITDIDRNVDDIEPSDVFIKKTNPLNQDSLTQIYQQIKDNADRM